MASKHLKDHDMNYFEHLYFAWKFGAELFYLGIIAMIHGLLPWTHETTVSNRIIDMAEKLIKLGRKPKPKNHEWK